MIPHMPIQTEVASNIITVVGRSRESWSADRACGYPELIPV